MADTMQIINRETSKGQLTGEADGQTITLYMDGEQVSEGRPTRLAGKMHRQLDDKYTHRVDVYPITEAEHAAYQKAAEQAKQERKEAALKTARNKANQTVTVKRRAGSGILVTGSPNPAVSDLLTEIARKAGLDLEADWSGGSREMTIGEILSLDSDDDVSDSGRREAAARASDSKSYEDQRHEANCGARYSRSAACECGDA